MQEFTTPALLWLLLLTLAVTAFSSGTEVAMLSANRYRVRSRAAAGDRRARMLDRLLGKPDDWLGANLIVLTLSSAGATTIATILAVRTGHEYALLLPTLIVPTVMLSILWINTVYDAWDFAERRAPPLAASEIGRAHV